MQSALSRRRIHSPAEMDGFADITMRKWQLSNRQALRLRDWDGDFAVFNPLSGHTHLLDYISCALLQALASGPASEIDLHRVLAEVLELADDEPLQDQLSLLLEQLDEQGLIEPVTPC